MSRWMMPRRCAASSASAICLAKWITRPGGDRAVLDHLLDRPPLEPLHRDERLPLVLAELVDRADVRVLQRRGEARFAFEPRQPLGRGDRVGAQQLDRDFAAEPHVFGAIHHAHAAFAEAVEQTIVGNHGRCHRHGARLARTARWHFYRGGYILAGIGLRPRIRRLAVRGWRVAPPHPANPNPRTANPRPAGVTIPS